MITLKIVVDRTKLDEQKKLAGFESDADLLRECELGPNTLTRIAVTEDELRKIDEPADFRISTVGRLAVALRCNPIDLLAVEGAPAPFTPALAFPAS